MLVYCTHCYTQTLRYSTQCFILLNALFYLMLVYSIQHCSILLNSSEQCSMLRYDLLYSALLKHLSEHTKSLRLMWRSSDARRPHQDPPLSELEPKNHPKCTGEYPGKKQVMSL